MNAEQQQEERTLRRALGPYMALAVVVGNVIGAGIFLKPGNIAAECGSFPVIISVWILGGVLCFLGALCFAELATMLPHAGGLYVYLKLAYGKLIGFLFGWTDLMFVRPASTGALAVAFVGSFWLSMGWTASAGMQAILAGAVILGMAWVNIVGVIWGGRVQLLVTAVKVVFLALVALSPFVFAPFVGMSWDISNFGSTTQANQIGIANQIGVALLSVMWAYNGWHGITPLSEEVANPRRNIPLALFGGIGILMALYLAANFAYHGVLSMEELKAAGDHGAEQMLYKLAGKNGQLAMSFVIMCSTFGAINTNLLQAPRIPFAMGRDGVFFRSLGTVHANYQTPVVAILTTSVMGILLIAAVAVGKHLVLGIDLTQIESKLASQFVVSLKDDSIFELLTNFVIFAASVFYMLGVLALIVLRFRFPQMKREYRTWGYPITPIVFLSVYTWFLTQVYFGSPLESRTGILMIMIGIPVYFAYKKLSNGKRV